MRHLRTAILAGTAVLLVAGVAEAATAKFHHMNVTLPDGSVAHIEYVGKVAPKVTVEPAAARRVAVVDPFLRMDRIMASMEARHRAMLAQMAALEQTASQQTAAAGDGQLVASSDVPAGAHYTMMSTTTTTDANGCTRTVEYRSNGNSKKPQVTRTSTGNCGKAQEGKTKSAPAAVPPLSDQV